MEPLADAGVVCVRRGKVDLVERRFGECPRWPSSQGRLWSVGDESLERLDV